LQAIPNSGDHVSGFVFMNEAPDKCWFLVSSFSGFAQPKPLRLLKEGFGD
jgi:hypothetical protein